MRLFSAHITALPLIACVSLLMPCFSDAQTTTTNTSTKAKPAAPNSGQVQNQTGQQTAPQAGKTMPWNTPAPAQNNASSNRSPIPIQGVGQFNQGVYTLTVYGCFRSGTRMFCDFDLTSRENRQTGLGAFGNVQLVDNGGKITPRNNAFYLATDGTLMQQAYVTTQPVRFIMEYDNIGEQVNSLSVVNGQNQIQSVPLGAIDSSQEGGFPDRSTLPKQQTGVAGNQGQSGQRGPWQQQGASTSSTQPATSATNSSTSTAQPAKKKAQSIWNQLKTATQH